MLSNFPVCLFDVEESQWPTFGIKFIEEDARASLSTLGFGGGLFTLVDYTRNLIETMLEAHDRFYIEESDFERRSAIDTLGVGIMEFDLSRERAMAPRILDAPLRRSS
jgi:NTE family protein